MKSYSRGLLRFSVFSNHRKLSLDQEILWDNIQSLAHMGDVTDGNVMKYYLYPDVTDGEVV